MAAGELLHLSARDQETLEAWLVTFGQSWRDEALAEWATTRLPAPGNPLRRLALSEMVKIDLEHQWQRGRPVLVESYLERYPELGSAATIGADLLVAEYQVRQQFGAPADVADFARRFPAQAAQLLQLLQQYSVTEAFIRAAPEELAGPAAARDTSHVRGATDTAAGVRRGQALTGTFGRYRIIRQLGQGGMGAVYLAHDTQLDRQVALKVPHFAPQDGAQVIERFLREARAMATIRHPNLCPVYDVGEIDGVHYLTMAYIEGHLLSEYIRPGKPAPERKSAGVVRKLALALQEAHGRGIVHRDLKPTNIFLDQRGEPIIMDFGLARRTAGQDAALTQDGALLGTPAYMAPEQARGEIEAIGPRTDIYSLGVILYELLTSHRPFTGAAPLAVLSQLLTSAPAPPRTHRPDLDPGLEAICLKAMAKHAEDRYATMTEFADALGEYLQAASRGMTLPSPATPAGSPVPNEAPGTPPAEASFGLTHALDGISHLIPAPGSAAPVQRRPEGSPGAASPGPGEDRSIVLATPQEGKPATRRPPPIPARSARRHTTRRFWIAVATAASCIAMSLGVVLLLSTPEGTVQIELSDPNAHVEVRVDGDAIHLTGIGQPLRLRTGEHQLVVTGQDFETVTRSFSVRRGSTEPLRITLVPKPAVSTSETPSPGGIADLVEKPAVSPLKSAEKISTSPTTTPPVPPPTTAKIGPAPPLAAAPFDAAKAKEHQAAWATHLGVPVEMTNSIGMKLTLVPPGEFLMGSPNSEQDRSDGELQHRVRMTKPFYLGVYEVTQWEYERVMGASPSHFKESGNSAPVEMVSWDEAQEFCRKLSALPAEQAAGWVYRLPTEAEWEYACRAGSTSRFCFGDSDDGLDAYAWFGNNSDSKTHPVGLKKPNAWGLYDMHGNVWEWCADWYDSGYYVASPSSDPQGPSSGSDRVSRGGGWLYRPGDCRSSYRDGFSPGIRSFDLGFRVARSPSGQ
jgi:formylglycine-generating enzyme required for sulfatase activity/serine/threonine protein kinase